jgi:hypothetical protein
VRERHEGCAAGKRLQRDQRTRLGDQTRNGKTARGREQPPFAPEAERAEIAALPIEAWPDLLIEVLQMLGVGKDCAPQKQRQPRAVRGIERQMEPLFRADAAQGQHEAAFCMLSFVKLKRDAIADDARFPRCRGKAPPLRIRDSNQDRRRAWLEHPSGIPIRRQVNGYHRREPGLRQIIGNIDPVKMHGIEAAALQHLCKHFTVTMSGGLLGPIVDEIRKSS